MNEFDKEWLEFMLKNRKWDKKLGKYRFLKSNEYHGKVKTVPVKLTRDDGSQYDSLQNIHDGWELGPLSFPYCQLCGKDLNEMRNTYGKKVVKFCCKAHSVEYSKRNRIRKNKFGEENTGFFWPTKKQNIVREDIEVTLIKNEEGISFPLQARKSKWAK